MLLFLMLTSTARAEPPSDDERDLEDFALMAPAETEPPLAWAALVGARVGPVFPMNSELSAAGMGWVDVGLSPPAFGGRLRGVAAVGYTAPRAQGEVLDPTLGEPLSYELHHRTLIVSAGLELRALHRREAVTPLLAVAPALFSTWTVVSGEGIASAREVRSQPGLRLTGGMEIAAGPGVIGLQVDYAAARLDGALTGATSLRLLQPNLGYRVSL